MQKADASLGSPHKFASLKVLFICIVISILLMMKSDSGSWLSSPRASVDAAIVELSGRMGWIVRLAWLAREYRALHSKIAVRTFELGRLEELRQENARLREQLGFRPRSEWALLHAEVVGKETNRLGTVILVNQGSLAGIKEGWIACSPDGLVGKVGSVGEEFSRIQLITNYNSPVSARVQRSGVEAIVEWKPSAPNTLIMTFVRPESDVRVGDVVVSSGLGGVYPAGLRIGTISKVSRTEREWEPHVEVKPFVDFSRLVEVLLVAPEVIKVEMRESGLFDPDAD
ncbi:MAG: rod shape-determining protein MreC [Candidatus Eiseniibacteriota bacterium]|nr:MAG: rod shape-determining protein MreC [Candidatus Eisenbacteria bacterium]